jgi:hypothetical protein
MINVAETMRKILPELKKGFDGVTFNELRPECEDQWNEGYAILEGLHYYAEGEYFDHDRLKADFEKKVRDHFPGCTITFYWNGAQEIEVRR